MRASSRARPPWIVIAAYVLFTLPAAVGAECERHGIDLGNSWFVFAGLACAVCFVAGALRFVRRHVAYRPDYGLWLAQTPWDVSKPLPLGSLFFEPRDLLWVVPMLLLASLVSVDFVLWVFVAALAGYVCVAILPVFRFAPPVFGYLALFTASCAFIAPLSPAWVIATLLVALAPVALGTTASLRSFPWHVNIRAMNLARKSMYRGVSSALPFTVVPEEERPLTREQIGWPWCALLGRMDALPGPLHAGIGGAFVGWFSFLTFRLVERHAAEDATVGAAVVTLILTLIFACVRLIAFLNEYRAPVSIWGRIWTCRLVIPRFDVVFLGSLVASVLALCAFLVQEHYVLRSVLTGMAAAVLLGAPPSIRSWVLTCSHRADSPRITREPTSLVRVR